MALGDTVRMLAELDLSDKFSGKLGQAGQALSGFESRLGKVGHGVGQVAGGLDKLATRAAVAAAGGLTAVVTTAVSFEDAFAGVRKTVDELDLAKAGLTFEDLNDQFREMARTIPLSFEELSALGAAAGALGIKAQDIQEFTRVTALIGVTTDVAAQDAATALGQLSTVLGLTGDDYDNFASTLVDLGNKGASTESQILELASRAGAGAHLIGIANDETLGWSSAVANLGIEVEAGGTALQKFFLESLRNLQDDDTLNIMAKTAGETGAAFKQAFEKDASGALVDFLDGLGKLDQAEQLAVLDALGFSDQRITRTLLGLAGDADNLTDSLDIAGNAWEENTALTEEAQKRFETTASQLTIIKNNVRDAANTIGVELLPIVKDLTGEFVAFLNLDTTQAGIKDFAKGLAGGIRDVITELKGTDFSGLIDGMKLAAEVAKGAFDAFRALPAPIQQLAIAALVANKVSGGALSQITKGLVNIGGGLLGTGGKGGVAGALLGRGNSPAAPLFVSVVGGLPGAGGVATAGGGGVAGLVSKVFLTGLAAEAGLQLGSFAADRLVDLGVGGIKPAKSFEQGALESTVKSEDLDRIVSGIDSIDENLAPSITDLGLSLEDSGQAIALALDLGGVKTQLEADRQVLISQLEAMGLTYAEAKKIVDAQHEAITKSGAGAVKLASTVEGLNFPLGIGNVIARQILDKGTAAVAAAHDTSAGIRESQSYLSTIAAKDLSLTVTIPIRNNISISASNVVRTLTSYTAAIGSGPGGALDPSLL